MILWVAMAAAETRLTVDEAMALAVERNPDVRSAELQSAIAAISLSRARLDRYTAVVSVNGGLDLGVTKPWDEPAYTSSSATWNAGATVGVPLYSGGRVDALVDRAEAGAAIAALERELTAREVVRAAYTGYWNIKGFELQIAAAEEGLAATEEALAIIRAKADAGLVAGIDVNRSTVDLYSQQEGLIAQRAALVQAEQDLVRLLRLDDDAVVLVDEPGGATAAPVVLPVDAGEQRPERARQELSVDQADAEVRLARSAALPTVSLTGSAGASALAAGQEPDPVTTIAGVPIGTDVTFDAADLGRPQVDAGVGLALTWNPFDLFRTRDAVRQARLAAEQVEERNTAENLRIAAELRSAAARLQALRDRAPLVEQQVGLARDNLAIVQDLYSQGSATILDLFNAQSSFRQALVLEAGLAVDLSTAELDLHWLLGEDVGARP